MKTRLLVRVMGLLSAAALSMLGLAAATPGATSIAEIDYLSATTDKHRILAAAPSPKLVLVGGSNLALGIDSARLELAFGRPTVNMGLYAGLGLRLMLDEVRPRVRAGDVIYVSPEYQLFWRETRRNDDAIATLVRVSFPECVARLPPLTLLSVAGTLWANEQESLSDVARAAFGLRRSGPAGAATAEGVEYFRQGFDGRGDYVAHLGKPPKDLSRVPLHSQPRITFDEDSVAALNDFRDFAESRGATAILGYPPLPASLYQANRALLDDTAAQVARGARMPVSGSPATAALPISMFYDTIYHLTEEGRQARTARVIDELRKADVQP